ncbi:MAG: hypothetical protein ACLTLY_02065 [Agathobacter rectalis]
MRRVIVNSTPLIALCNADLLNILKKISSVKNAITKIQSNGFYINENIIKLALKQAGEL